MSNIELLRISELLEQSGMTGKELADKIGIHPVSISAIVNNKTLPSKENMVKIAKVFNVGVRDLFIEDKDSIERIYKRDQDGNYIDIGILKKH